MIPNEVIMALVILSIDVLPANLKEALKRCRNFNMISNKVKQ